MKLLGWGVAIIVILFGALIIGMVSIALVQSPSRSLALLDELSKFAWAIVALVVFVMLLPAIRALLQQRSFTLTIGRFQVSVQSAAQNYEAMFSDITGKVADLAKEVARLSAGTQELPPPEPTSAGPTDRPPRQVRVSQPPQHRLTKHLRPGLPNRRLRQRRRPRSDSKRAMSCTDRRGHTWSSNVRFSGSMTRQSHTLSKSRLWRATP